jgi:hypothetical protein
MAALDLGARASVTWPDAPAGETSVLVVKRPDGQVLDPAPVVTGAGPDTEATFLPPMAGRYLLSWSAGTDAHTDILDVWPEDPRFIISLDDAEAGLNTKGRASAEYLADLRLYIAAATPVIEDIVGSVVVSPETYATHGGRHAIVLPKKPDSITAVTVDGEALTDFYTEYGILYSGSRGYPSAFGWGEVVVTYQSGNATIPPNVRLATRELVRHWVQIGKHSVGGKRPEATDGETHTPSGYAVPRRVIELCAPHERTGALG